MTFGFYFPLLLVYPTTLYPIFPFVEVFIISFPRGIFDILYLLKWISVSWIEMDPGLLNCLGVRKLACVSWRGYCNFSNCCNSLLLCLFICFVFIWCGKWGKQHRTEQFLCEFWKVFQLFVLLVCSFFLEKIADESGKSLLTGLYARKFILSNTDSWSFSIMFFFCHYHSATSENKICYNTLMFRKLYFWVEKLTIFISFLFSLTLFLSLNNLFILIVVTFFYI